MINEMDLRIVHKAALFFFFFFCFVFCFSQTPVKVKANIDRNSILIGERIRLTLEADIPENQPIRFFTIDTIDHFEFLERGKIDTINTISGTMLRQQLLLTSFDSGIWVIPSYALDRQNEIKTDSFIINVGFTPFDTAQAYHDIKDIIGVEVEKKKENYWLYVAAGAVFILVMVYLLTRRKKPKATVEKIVDPFEEAMQQLDALQKQNLPIKEYYTRLTEIFRTYMTKKKNISSLQKTTDELVTQLRTLHMDPEDYQKLANVLRLCDFVKFAKYQPGTEDARIALSLIKNSIQSIEKIAR